MIPTLSTFCIQREEEGGRGSLLKETHIHSAHTHTHTVTQCVTCNLRVLDKVPLQLRSKVESSAHQTSLSCRGEGEGEGGGRGRRSIYLQHLLTHIYNIIMLVYMYIL